MFYLIINNKKVAENKSFDKLQARVDADMEGFVVDSRDWMPTNDAPEVGAWAIAVI